SSPSSCWACSSSPPCSAPCTSRVRTTRPMPASISLQGYLVLAAVLFAVGLFGVVTRRNTIGILLGIELMLNAVNINLVAFARFNGDVVGMVFTLFTICITVAEVALGLALVILIFRVRRTAIADHLDLLRGCRPRHARFRHPR